VNPASLSRKSQVSAGCLSVFAPNANYRSLTFRVLTLSHVYKTDITGEMVNIDHTHPVKNMKKIGSNTPFRIICYQHLFISTLLLFAVLFVMEGTNLDMSFQRLFYQNGGWLVDNTQTALRLLLYKGPRFLIAAYAAVLLFLFIASLLFTGFRKFRTRKNMFILLCLVLVPLVIAITKKLTNIHCPYELQEFGGSFPYVSLFTSSAAETPGRCFPAGHPSGGFAFLLFVMIATTRSRQMMALAGALMLGGLMGSYQILNGRHTLGHTLTTLIVSWIIILLLHYLLFGRQKTAYGHSP